jgi:chromosome segregation ATPase
VLSNDQARDTFSRTFNAAAFLQKGISLQSLRRQQAAAVLTSTAARTHSPVLSALASQVRLDAFTRVKQAIDQMVAELLQEASDEVKHRDFCIKESAKNERDTAKEVHTKAAAQDDVDRLKLLIEGHAAAIARLQSEITDLQTALQRATEDRDAENKDFSRIVLDQRETQRMLQQATDVLKRIYRPDATPSLVQSGDQRGNRQTPPPGFTKYEKQVGGGDGVLALLQQILADAKEMEAQAMHDEQEAVRALESFKNETDASVSAKQDSIINRQAEKGQAEEELVEAESDLENAQVQLGFLSKGLADLKKSCDFFLDNFEVRSQARDEEVDALRQAKAFLSGMSIGGVVEKS